MDEHPSPAGGRQAARPADLNLDVLREVLRDLGLEKSRLAKALVASLLWPTTQRFAWLAANFDGLVEERGLVAAARWIVPQLYSKVRVEANAEVPQDGPLLVASNHPGGGDGLLLASLLGRRDLKIVVSGLSILRSLRCTARHLIYVPRTGSERMLVIRQVIRHLREDGALLIFPSGSVDPDPDVLPGAERALDRWSPSLGVILRSVPQTQVQLSILSSIVKPDYVGNPLARLRGELRDRQKSAEMLQVIQQLYFPGSVRITARLSLSDAMNAGELHADDPAFLTQALIGRARRLLEQHQAGRPGGVAGATAA
jgi:hypothetical protein